MRHTITPYHAKYIAHDLTRLAARDGLERLSMALFDANVDLNPHQIEAALFALRSPVNNGVILADEVGLGKTIEACLVLGQFWAERKRRLLVICPASIRKQWATELEEKFNLPSVIIDARSAKQALSAGNANPFQVSAIAICSYNFAARCEALVRAVDWNMTILDEAHKLRNAHQSGNRIGQAIRSAISGRRKVLLTATPLQNTLMELYGMCSVIDEHMFGEPSAFRAMYTGSAADLAQLKERLHNVCKRTLRKDVAEYVPFTERHPLTRTFRSTDDEHKLYEAVSAYLQRKDTYGIPERQRVLVTLRLRKILASSSHAIAATLDNVRDRLIALRDGLPEADLVERIIAGDDLTDDDFFDESLETETDSSFSEGSLDRARLAAEIDEIDGYARWARGIGIDSKTRALIAALQIGFEKMVANGAARKALIFTESRRTQMYLRDFLEANGYAGKVACFNGSNSDEQARNITNRWIEENRDAGRVSESRDVNARSAIIDYFRNLAEILIATEAAAEGVNLQFCSMVVNYDLPWNPQRIEQRIGRCHRYGQTHDVVVVNFVNERNDADRRTFELLEQKFQLFDGLFGTSDDVLGTIESGVDFEKAVYTIYQTCRTPDEIDKAFAELRSQLEASIKVRMDSTRQMLLEFFDEEIHERMRLQLQGARSQLDRYGRHFWALTRFMLTDTAEFNDEDLTFRLSRTPGSDIHSGKYRLISKERDNEEGEYLYRLSHPLGQWVVDQAKSLDTPIAHVIFNISDHPGRITVVEELRGTSGWLTLDKLTVESFELEEYLLLSGIHESGSAIDPEVLQKLFLCGGSVQFDQDTCAPDRLEAEAVQHQTATMHRSFEANNRFMNEERDRLECWADDMIIAAERDLRDTKSQLRESKRLARQAITTDEQIEMQTKIRDLEQRQRRQRQRIFEVEDEIIAKRDHLIAALQRRMEQKTHSERLFTIRWSVW